MSDSWRTYYIYYYNGLKQDEIIIKLGNVMRKLLSENKIRKWFFIRYWEGGPHVRLRYLTDQDLDYNMIFDDSIQFIKHNPFPKVLTKEEYYKNNKLDGIPIPIEKLPWHNEGEIIKAEYIPEYERYGGPDLMPLTESMFMISSEYVLELVKVLKNRHFLIRFFYALLTVKNILALIEEKGFFEVSQEVYVKNCIESWRNLYSIDNMEYAKQILENCNKNTLNLQKINSRLVKEEIYQITVESFINGLQKILKTVNSNKKFRSVLFSHLHMLNNRFSIGPEYECALYYVILKKEIW